MGRGNRDNRFCPRLVHLGELVEEHKRELVVLVGDLDHVAVNRIKGGRNIYRNFLSCHDDQVCSTGMKYVGSKKFLILNF